MLWCFYEAAIFVKRVINLLYSNTVKSFYSFFNLSTTLVKIFKIIILLQVLCVLTKKKKEAWLGTTFSLIFWWELAFDWLRDIAISDKDSQRIFVEYGCLQHPSYFSGRCAEVRKRSSLSVFSLNGIVALLAMRIIFAVINIST